jgi:hypothetical protein
VDDRIWLVHPETGNTFHCPADAAQAWIKRGWAECDPPQEDNPALAEYVPMARHEPKPKTRRGTPAVPAETADPSTTESSEGVISVG